MKKPDNSPGSSRGIQSLDTALQMLVAMTKMKSPISLSDLARDCRMPPSKVHRYLSSFLHAGLVEQAEKSGKYSLGAGCVTLGLAAISRFDFVNRASEAMPELCAESGLTALLSVWGNQGATVIRWQRAASPTVTSMGLGTTLPLLSSATGRAFLAWAPPAPLQATRDTELRRIRQKPAIAPDLPATNEDLEALREKTISRGYAFVDGKYIPGLVAIAAPILDWQGEAQAVVTLIGTDPMILQPDSNAVRQLGEFCQALSFAPIKRDQSGKTT